MKGLEAHRDDAKVQMGGFRFLAGAVTMDYNHHKIAVKTLDGIEAVVAGLNTHQDNPEVQAQGFLTLQQMYSRADENEGLIEVVVAGMLKHPTQKKVQQNGASYLYAMVWPYENPNQANQRGNLEVIKRIKDAWVENKGGTLRFECMHVVPEGYEMSWTVVDDGRRRRPGPLRAIKTEA